MIRNSNQFVSLLLSSLLLGSANAAPAPAPAAAFPGFGNPLQLTPHHITASVANVDRAVEWYRTKLGFEVLKKGVMENGANKTPFAELRISSFGIAFVQLRGEPKGNEAPATPAVPAAPAPRWVHIVFRVPDPQATFDLLKSRGVDVFVRAGQSTNPVKEFQLRDSEGNQIEITADSTP